MTPISFNSVEIPAKFFESRLIGIEALDEIFSENKGLVPSMVYMFTGVSGAGKTTISNYLLAGLGTKDSPAIFISLEMSKEQAKHQFGKKVNLQHTLILDAKDYDGKNNMEYFKASLEALVAHNPSVVVIDSLQYASQIFAGNPTSVAGQTELTDIILKFAKKHEIPVVVIGQCTKDGNYAGPSFIKHAFDAHLHAEYDPNTNTRYVEFHKNRFGKTMVSLFYEFQEDGSLKFFRKGSFLETSFYWHNAQETILSIYKTVISREIAAIVKAGIHMPQIRFNGSEDVEVHEETYHPGITTWMHFPSEPFFIYNTIFVELDAAKEKFTEENLDVLKVKYRDYLDRYPYLKTAKQLFLLQILIHMTQALLQSSEQSPKFWKTLNRLTAYKG